MRPPLMIRSEDIVGMIFELEVDKKTKLLRQLSHTAQRGFATNN